MVTKRTYKCNVCRTEVDNSTGVGFDFKSGNIEFQEGSVNQHENHLCLKCINATYDLSKRIYNKK